jgi:hypothetical protein
MFGLSDTQQLGEDKVCLEGLLSLECVEFFELALEGVEVLGLGYLCD